MGSSGNIGSILAAFAHFDRDIEIINDVYATYDSLTAEDVRSAANTYFVDDSRVTFTLSSDESMPGIDGMTSLDELVAAAGMADAPPPALPAKEAVTLPSADVAAEDMTEVAFVAKPSASSPLVNVSFLVHTGAAFDPEGKKGLASLTAAMIAEGGSQAKTIDEINAAMFPMAAGFGAQVDKEMTRLAGQVHKDNLDAWYELVRGQLLYPAWSEKDFARVRTQIKNAIRTDLVGNNDEELGKEFLYTQIYGPKHPYGSLTLGAVSDIESITLDDVKAFYREHYTVANITVGLSGGYPESFPVRLSEDLQLLEAGEKMAMQIPPAPVIEGRHAAIIEKETPGVAVSFGFPIDLRRGDPDWVALWLVRSWLGEHRSTNSYLFQRIRETRGMNYGDYAYIEYFPRGMFQFHPDTNLGRQQQIFQVWIRPVRSNNDAHFATRVALYELDKLVENGMTESDFEASRAYLSKFVSLLTDGQSRQLGYALDSQYYGTADFADYVRNGLSKLTLDDVNRVLRENLDMSDMQYVFVTRDGNDLRERLLSDQRSPMTYDAELPADVLEEDQLIDNIAIGFDSVEVVPSDQVFD
jgi:zinc protease